MIKAGIAIAAFVVVASGCAAVGAQEKATDQRAMMQHKGMAGTGGMMGSGGMMDMKKMDSNNDGSISKDEFMSAHEKMFNQMKSKDGAIDVKNMPMCCKMMEQSKDTSKMMGDSHGMQGQRESPSR